MKNLKWLFLLGNFVKFHAFAYFFHHPAGSKQTSPATRRRTPKPRDIDPNVDIPPPEQAEMLIMGIIRDKNEQKFHEAHQVHTENI